MDATGAIEDIGVPSSTVRTPAVGLSVAKSGRTTGFTTGTISSISTTVTVRYPSSCGSNGGTNRTFTNQVVINSTTFSAGGDSGSLIVTNNSCHQPVALLFAGSSSSTIGNPVGLVLTRLSASLGRTVSFVGTTCTSAAMLEAPDSLQANRELSDAVTDFAAAVLQSRTDDLMSRPGVIGVGVSAADDQTSDAAIIVYIDSTAGLEPNLPKSINGVKVRRFYTTPFIAY